MPDSTETNKTIVAVIDVDSFEVQVYQKMKEYAYSKGKPTIIVDPNSKRLLSISPEAKLFNISRKDKEREARSKCPDLISIVKKIRFDKPDSKPLRLGCFKLRQEILDHLDRIKEQAGSEVGGMEMIQLWTTTMPVQLNGCDEFFMDLTDIVDLQLRTWEDEIEGLEDNKKIILEGTDRAFRGQDLEDRILSLMMEGIVFRRTNSVYTEFSNQETRMLVATKMMDSLLDEIRKETGFDCTVGIGSNMVRAKIACKLNKPAAVTAMLDSALPRIAQSFDFQEVTGLGGDLGEKVLAQFGPMKLTELQNRVRGNQLISLPDRPFQLKDIHILRELAYARTNEKVVTKLFNKSLSCGKSNLFFRSPSEFKHRVGLLCEEMVERIAEEKEFNKRAAEKLSLSYSGKGVAREKQLSFKTENDGSLRLTAGAMHAECIRCAVSENAEFSAHLCRITEISLKVLEFSTLGDVYVDEIAQSGMNVFNFVTDRSKNLF